MASLAMLDIFFLLLDIQIAYAKVKGNNLVAHNYNSELGFSRTKKIEHGMGYEYMLQKEIYLLKTKRLRNTAIRLKGNQTIIEVIKQNPIDTLIANRIEKANKDTIKTLEVQLIRN